MTAWLDPLQLIQYPTLSKIDSLAKRLVPAPSGVPVAYRASDAANRSRDGRTVPGDGDDAWPAFIHINRVLERGSFAVSFYVWPNADRFLHAYRSAGFRVIGHFTFLKRAPRGPSAVPARVPSSEGLGSTAGCGARG